MHIYAAGKPCHTNRGERGAGERLHCGPCHFSAASSGLCRSRMFPDPPSFSVNWHEAQTFALLRGEPRRKGQREIKVTAFMPSSQLSLNLVIIIQDFQISLNLLDCSSLSHLTSKAFWRSQTQSFSSSSHSIPTYQTTPTSLNRPHTDNQH
jgi:hypothetical protein